MDRIYTLFLLSYFTPSLSSTLEYDYWSIETTGSASFPCASDHAYVAGVSSIGYVYVGKGTECTSDFIAILHPVTETFTSSDCPANCPLSQGFVPQYYTQTGDILYAMDGLYIDYVDLSGGSAWSNLIDSTTGISIKFPRAPTNLYDRCLASTPDGQYLIAVGGHLATTATEAVVQIYDLTNEIFVAANDLPEGRAGLGCVVHPYDDSLYAMGGHNEGGDHSGDYYKLLVDDMANVASYDWTTYSEASLLELGELNRLIAYDKYLIALGGGHMTSSTSYIAAWDLSSGTPVLFASTLEISGFAWGNSAYALFGNKIYVFGDRLSSSTSSEQTNWQTVTLSLPTATETIDYDYWSIQTTASSSFPCTVDHAYAAGVDSSGVVYVGKGIECTSDFFGSYDPSTDTWTSADCPASCPISTEPVPQYYTQTGDMLYAMDGLYINYVDLSGGSAWSQLIGSTGFPVKFPKAPTSVVDRCLASTPDGQYLIALGGWLRTTGEPEAVVHIFDLVNEIFVAANDLPEARTGLGCVVHPYDDSLYAMGGHNEGGDHSGDYYKLLVDNVANVGTYDWTTYSEASLLTLGELNRLIAYDKYLIALGGREHTTISTAWRRTYDLFYVIYRSMGS
eukprot:425380_1